MSTTRGTLNARISQIDELNGHAILTIDGLRAKGLV